MKQRLFLVALFVMAVIVLISCDSLWSVKETTDITFKVSKSALEEFLKNDSVQAASYNGSGHENIGLTRSIDFDDDGIEMTLSLHNAGNDSVIISKTLVVKEDESVIFDNLAIVGKIVYAKVRVEQDGEIKEGRSKTKKMVEGENSLYIATLLTVVYKIGDTGPGGGIIFYADSTTSEYKEISDNLGEYNWYQASGMFHETHNSNSISIAKDYDGGDFTDWYLPTIEELQQAYTNARVPEYIFETRTLWSSSEQQDNLMYGQNFYSGALTYGEKDKTEAVRAIRYFNTSSF